MIGPPFGWDSDSVGGPLEDLHYEHNCSKTGSQYDSTNHLKEGGHLEQAIISACILYLIAIVSSIEEKK